MKKIRTRYFLLSLVFLFLFVTAAHAYVVPTLSLLNLNNGTIQAEVQGDPNSAVELYYYNQQYNIGYTNVSGYLYTTLNASQYNIPAGASVYVTINGTQSQIVSWPYNTSNYYNYYNYNAYNVPPITFNQTNLSLTQGQNASLTMYGGSGSYYISGSAAPILNITITGSTMNVYAASQGSANVVVCSQNGYYGNTANYYGNNSVCGSVNITVTASYYPVYYPNYPTYYPNYYPAYNYNYDYNGGYRLMYRTF